jgi:hypothetical protein
MEYQKDIGNEDEWKKTEWQTMHMTNQVKRHVERRGQDWRMVDKMQEWVDRDNWRLLCKS